MIAKVIVDVPAKPTNRAFDYVVPEPLLELVAVGSRVGVPFGPRTVQGFVVELQNGSDIDVSKLKPIKQVLDVTPPLTPELVKLARWIGRTYVCHEIVALQAMIPGALKAKYERHVAVAEESERAETAAMLFPEHRMIVDFVRKQESVELESLLAKFPEAGGRIKQLLEEGVLVERQMVKDRMMVKKALTVFPPDDPSQLDAWIAELPARAAKQHEVLRFFSRAAGTGAREADGFADQAAYYGIGGQRLGGTRLAAARGSGGAAGSLWVPHLQADDAAAVDA